MGGRRAASHRLAKWLFTSVVLVAAAGCANLKGIQAFGKMAPDPSTIQGLTRVYVQELDVMEDLKLLGDSPANPYLDANTAQRVLEARAIQQVDACLRTYMESLSALAGGDIVQSGTNMKDVNAGLKSLSKSVPALGISEQEVSTIGHFVQSVADLLESGYRNAELVKIIRDNDPDLQLLLAVQSKIVLRGIRPSIVAVQKNLSGGGAREIARFIDQDLQNWTVSPGHNAPAEHDKAAAVFNGRNPAFRGQGEADAHVARYLFRKSIEADQQALDTELATAEAYAKTLDAIGRAHRTLVASGKGVLGKETLQQIQPLANEVRQDWKDLQAQAALPAKH